jgi:uncharacterized membrane protein
VIDQLLFGLGLVSALGCGLMAGVFFAFSTFVMRALARLPPAEGIAAMQAINVAVLNPWFLAPFLGTAAGCLVLAGTALLARHTPGAVQLLVGSLCYLVGTLMVTIVCNVPRNGALARVEPGTTAGARTWADYRTGWSAWNHVRTTAAVVATIALTMALSAPRHGGGG